MSTEKVWTVEQTTVCPSMDTKTSGSTKSTYRHSRQCIVDVQREVRYALERLMAVKSISHNDETRDGAIELASGPRQRDVNGLGGRIRDERNIVDMTGDRFEFLHVRGRIPSFHFPPHLSMEVSGFMTLHHDRSVGNSLVWWRRKDKGVSISDDRPNFTSSSF